MNRTLFPKDLPEKEWVRFQAEGYSHPASGIVCRKSSPAVCGMPLGGLDTGCIDLETNGTLGACTIFNSHVPRRGPLNMPFLCIAVGKYTWVLTTTEVKGLELSRCGSSGCPEDAGLKNAKDIHYWGHYPVADMEFELDAPVSVGMRAWSPFIPGDVAVSNTPGAIFAIHLRNVSASDTKGTIVFSFPGPSPQEAGGDFRFAHKKVEGEVSGVQVTNGGGNEYVLGVIGSEKSLRLGADVGTDGGAWSRVARVLPPNANQAGVSAAVDFELRKGEEKTIRFVLAWYCPRWNGGGTPMGPLYGPQWDGRPSNTYTHMYASRYGSALEVANLLARDHESLLRRILAWQEVIYAQEILPSWLKDSLINVLYLIPELSFWAQAKPPVGDWCRPADGVFGLNDDPRSCAQVGHIGCSWYSGITLAYFFPELLLSLLRTHKQYQYPDGAMAWAFSSLKPAYCEMVEPYYRPRPIYQDTANGVCYAAMVDWYWRLTGDEEFLSEFYPSVKQNTVFTMNLAKDAGPAHVISIPPTGGNDWFECVDMFGMVSHIGGLHLAQLRIVQRMAEAVGDKEFYTQCHQWFEQGSQMLEEHLWAGSHYLLYNYTPFGKEASIVRKKALSDPNGYVWYEEMKLPPPGAKCDVIMGYQLTGEYLAKFHGLPSVFRPDRVKTTLSTLRKTSLVRRGVIAFAEAPNGTYKLLTNPPPDYKLKENELTTGYWTSCGVFPPGSLWVGMLLMYHGEKESGVEIARRTMHGLVIEKGWAWSLPNVILGDPDVRFDSYHFDGDAEERFNGYDYGQNMLLWSLPAALEGGDLSSPCKPGGLVDRVLQAGRRE